MAATHRRLAGFPRPPKAGSCWVPSANTAPPRKQALLRCRWYILLPTNIRSTAAHNGVRALRARVVLIWYQSLTFHIISRDVASPAEKTENRKQVLKLGLGGFSAEGLKPVSSDIKVRLVP
jgi:hypothetical protein